EDRRLQDARSDSSRLLPVAVTGQAGRDDRVVVRPNGPEVIADRVVTALPFGHRAHAPAGPQAIPHHQLDAASCLVLVGDSAPEQVADVRGDRVDEPAVAVDGQGETAAIIHPVVAVETRFQVGGRLLEPVREVGIVPDPTGETSASLLGVVYVALDLAGCPRQPGVGPVREEDRVPGVFPALVVQACLRVAALVVDVTVAVTVAV